MNDYFFLALPLIVAYVVLKTFRIYTNPLNYFPGPWYAKFTNIPGTFASLTRQQVQYYHKLHQKYGSHVRVGPNQVFVSDIESFKTVHKIGGNFQKANYYHYFGPTEAGKPPYGLFQMTNVADHTKRRKLLGRGFTASSLRVEWETMVRMKVIDAVEGMRNEAESSGGEVDIRRWWICMASDVVSKVMFGESFDALLTGQEDPWFSEVKIANQAAFASKSFPWLYAVAKKLPLLGNAKLFHAHKVLLSKGYAAVSNSRKMSESENANIFAKALGAKEENHGMLLNDLDIAVEAGSFMIAGTDTTSNTLTYLIWAVLSQPELQTALEKELYGLDDSMTDAKLEELPVLHAVIQETLRLYGAAPTPLPRVVPPGGAHLGTHYLPAGTEVATQSFTMHRDPNIFADPERFDHSRWLPTGKCTNSKDAQAAFAPFGAGSRVCIGKHLAYMELRYGAAFFFRRLRKCKLAQCTTPASMEMDNLVLIEPRGKVCKVIL